MKNCKAGRMNEMDFQRLQLFTSVGIATQECYYRKGYDYQFEAFKPERVGEIIYLTQVATYNRETEFFVHVR